MQLLRVPHIVKLLVQQTEQPGDSKRGGAILNDTGVRAPLVLNNETSLDHRTFGKQNPESPTHIW